MTIELEKQLVNKYPQFFIYLKNHKSTDPITPIQFGFECDDGWYWLLDNLMETIESYIKNNSTKKRIKYKFFRYIYDVLEKWYIKVPYKMSKPIKSIRTYIRNKNEWVEYESIPEICITQIKEKYGNLCFYYHGGNEIIEGMVWLAEHQSSTICETCGTTEKVYQTKGWIKTTCEKCTPFVEKL